MIPTNLLDLAEQAGLEVSEFEGKLRVHSDDGRHWSDGDLALFASLIVQQTAEECARVCEGMPDREYNYPLTREEEGVERGWETGRMNCAQAIRTKYQLSEKTT